MMNCIIDSTTLIFFLLDVNMICCLLLHELLSYICIRCSSTLTVLKYTCMLASLNRPRFRTVSERARTIRFYAIALVISKVQVWESDVLADFETICKLTTITTCAFQGLAGLHKHLPSITKLKYFVLLRHEISS
jgi:hypothetical protein